MKNGVILVLLLLVAGLVAAGAAIWHQYRQTRRALEYWGTEAAYLIGHAPSVELTAAHRPTPGTERPKPTDGEQRTVDISQARGLVHFRRSLLEDENFDWDETPPAGDTDWDYAVRFGGDEAGAELVFDLDRGLVAERSHADVPAILTARMVAGLAHFFEETLEQGGK